MSNVSTRLPSLGVACTLLLVLQARAQRLPEYRVQRIDPSGPAYEDANGATDAWAVPQGDLVLGSSRRMDSAELGRDAWLWTNGQTIPVGLRGPNYVDSIALRVDGRGHVGGLSTFVDRPLAGARVETWIWNGQESLQIGLTGPAYIGADGSRFSQIEQTGIPGVYLSSAIVGYTSRKGSGATAANDWWTWDGTQTRRLALLGPDYTDASGFVESRPLHVTRNGRIIGSSKRYRTDGFPHGSDVWYWNGQELVLVPLMGPEYTAPDGFRSSFAKAQNENGLIVGTSTRYFANNVSRIDAWVSVAGASPTRIGFTGGGYDQPGSLSQPLLFNELGDVVGTSFDAVSNQSTSWRWRNGVVTSITLTNPPGESYQSLVPTHLSESGLVAGYAARANSLSSPTNIDAWVWDGQQTHIIGLRGPEYTSPQGERASGVVQIANEGLVLGSSRVFRSNGDRSDFTFDKWIWDGATTTRVGLFDPIHFGASGYRSTMAYVPEDCSYVIGSTMRIVPGTEDYLGTDCWVWENGVTTRVGLTGPGYTALDGKQVSQVITSDRAGRVLGRSTRLTPDGEQLGRTAFYYDPITRVSTGVELSVRASDSFASSDWYGLTSDGYGIGVAEVFADGQDEGVPRGFMFRPDVGVIYFDDLVSGGVASSGWATLGGAYFAESRDLYVGRGRLAAGPLNTAVFALTHPQGCDSIDFNRNGLAPEDADVAAFFDVLSGAPCDACGDIDFNNNQVSPEDQDVIDFLDALTGGSCP
ncbi:MAG TPA: hypothetical protein VK157_17505 [Phycisphaerales bacterium]|nr:hypothetical protein [Phycisphaerales bacterium]